MTSLREAVDQAERVPIESIMDSGWTWAQLGTAAALQTARRATDLDRPATIGTRPARDPEEEARRRLSWTERLNDSLNELDDLINNRMSTSPGGPAAGARGQIRRDLGEIERGRASAES